MNFSVTTVELAEGYGISKTLAYDWFDVLEAKELAKLASGRVWGTKLFSQDAVEFLLTRKGKVGSPGQKWSKSAHLDAWLEEKGKCQ